MWNNWDVAISLAVRRFGGAPPHGMARDCCVPLLLQRVSLSLVSSPVSGCYGDFPFQHIQPVLSWICSFPAGVNKKYESSQNRYKRQGAKAAGGWMETDRWSVSPRMRKSNNSSPAYHVFNEEMNHSHVSAPWTVRSRCRMHRLDFLVGAQTEMCWFTAEVRRKTVLQWQKHNSMDQLSCGLLCPDSTLSSNAPWQSFQPWQFLITAVGYGTEFDYWKRSSCGGITLFHRPLSTGRASVLLPPAGS